MSAKGWKCCGCGVVSADGRKPCDCVTICAYLPDEKGSRVWDDCNLYEDARDARIRTLLEEKASSQEEIARLTRGLSALVHCQSPLSRKDMREAAAGLLTASGVKPVDFGSDQSPFVARALAAEAEIARLRKAMKEFGTSRVRDRVAARVGCNHDILHDALQQEVARAPIRGARQMADVLAILAEAKKALEYSSSSLESIESYDDEDRAPDGGSKACKACVKINTRAIAKIDAYLAALDATQTQPDHGGRG